MFAGLPKKFAVPRKQQVEAGEWINDIDGRSRDGWVCAASLPTGSGKTVLGVALAQATARKTVYLVSTKALQEQVHSDFASIGMVDIRGRANYTCPNHDTCERGFEHDCSLSNTLACSYTEAVERARSSRMIVTNYAYWLNARLRNDMALAHDDDPIGLLICDEAHNLVDELTRFFSVRISDWEADLPTYMPDESGLMDECGAWLVWAGQQIAGANAIKLKLLSKTSAAVAKKDDRWIAAEKMIDKCKRITLMGANWVYQFGKTENGIRYVEFSPIRVSSMLRTLFAGVPRVFLMSGTLNRFAMELLIPDGGAFNYRAWPSTFPPTNRPVYHVPTRKLSWRSTDEDYTAIIARMDDILDSRRDRKGIIHTVSYARTQRALRISRHADSFIWNGNSSDLQGVLERFRRAPAGAVLVSPSVGTGFDFPDADAEYQVILKFPFPNETSRVVKERCNRIPNFRLYSAAMDFVQMCGRPIRSATDRAETFCLDNSVAQLKGPSGKALLPPGFRIWTVNTVPSAPPKQQPTVA